MTRQSLCCLRDALGVRGSPIPSFCPDTPDALDLVTHSLFCKITLCVLLPHNVLVKGRPGQISTLDFSHFHLASWTSHLVSLGLPFRIYAMKALD